MSVIDIRLAKPKMLTTNTVYGPVFQGEGPRRGQPALFLRTYGCNLTCTWCDTWWTWDTTRHDVADERHVMDTRDVVSRLADLWQRGNGLVVTGGEPMMRQPALAQVITGLQAERDHLPFVQVETNGTLPLRELRQFNNLELMVSVKLTNSGVDKDKRLRPVALRDLFGWWGPVYLKPVVGAVDELLEVEMLVEQYGLHPSQVWVMPEGTNPESLVRLARELEPHVIGYGWNLTLRDHVLMHPDQREV